MTWQCCQDEAGSYKALVVSATELVRILQSTDQAVSQLASDQPLVADADAAGRELNMAVQKLVEAGFNVNARDIATGHTALLSVLSEMVSREISWKG